jgi:hypothetical protein
MEWKARQRIQDVDVSVQLEVRQQFTYYNKSTGTRVILRS